QIRLYHLFPYTTLFRSDDFSDATDDNIDTPEYMALPDDDSKPMYISRAGSLEVEDSQVSMMGRFTIGAREAVDTTEDFTPGGVLDRKSTRLNSSHVSIS